MALSVEEIRERAETFMVADPFDAREMLPELKIKRIMKNIEQPGRSWKEIWEQAWTQVRDQIHRHVGLENWAVEIHQYTEAVESHVWRRVGDRTWDEVGFPSRDQIKQQVWISSFMAIRDHFDLDFDHPAFTLTRAGILIYEKDGAFKVFGLEGRLLGELSSSLHISNNHMQIKH